MKTIIIGILLGIASFFALQMTLPFPYGLVIWFIILWLIIKYAKKYTVIHKDSVLNYRRIDPINEKEKLQNDEALRILEKKYIEEKISKEEYLKRKKEFLDIEYNPRKCKVCGSEDFELISGEQPSDIDYRCKRCGENEN
ncbi:hypothetical protein [Nitrosopumilus sp.]|uniref:hypothetical protein n=1 Tax=Nitrosopumilus sp. TaxID=2024843 RepID=UPI00349FFA61